MSEWKETAIGLIPKDWDLKTIDEIKSSEKKSIISGPFGSNISAKYFTPNGVPVVRGNNLSLELGVKFKDNGFVFITEEKANELSTWAKKDDIIFTAVGTIGQVGILLGNEKYSKYIISNKQLRIRINESIVEPLFAYYWFSCPQMTETIVQRNTGSSVPLINLSVLKSLYIPIPPKSIRLNIVKILSCLDDKIDLLHRQNKTLEQLAETLFRQWFVEEVEESWEKKAISDIIDVRDGTHDSPKQSLTGKYLITSKHLKPSGIDFATAYKISEKDFIEVNKRSKVDLNDILFSMIGTLGLIHYVDSEPDFAIKNMGLFKSSQKPKFANFLFLLLKGSIGQKFIHENAVGSTQEYITLGSLRNFEFNYPGEKQIEKFDIIVEPMFNKIKLNTNQIRTLTQLRDTLLPKLMSGEVRVENI